jgi:hypothetical protein
LLNVTSLQWRSVTTKVQLGRAFGQLPFDELFMIGLDRDSDLWPAHIRLLSTVGKTHPT